MTNQQVEHLIVQFLDSVGCREAARLIRASSANGQSPRWGSSGAIFTSEDEPDYIHAAREQARRYCEERNKNLKPARQIAEVDENARAGKMSALEFLERRKRSAIRK
jgi:hypothetical protein